ncbi:MAG TPA: heparinase II/III family protein [Thermoanaerobaculia bacterium]|nr:heparinase II/III family protein [Thermoanaerobaculia bacterium]
MYDRSRWRSYVLQTRAHNTILIDGMDQFAAQRRDAYVWPRPWDTPVPRGCDTRWFSADGTDWCEG